MRAGGKAMRTIIHPLAALLRIVLVLALLPALAHAQTATTTTFTVTPVAATVGQNLTLVAQVAGASPTGTVTFTAGGSPVGAVALSAGIASFSTSALPQGSHSLAASYAGDANNQASTSSSVAVTISARPPYTWQYGYDAMGRPNTVVDPNGLASYTYYDNLGRPIQNQQPPNTGSSAPTVIDYGWNLQDSLTSVTDPRSLATTYSPNGLGRVAGQSSPDSGTATFTYDAKGNMLTRTDARGKTTTYAYDALDRVTSISYASGAPTTFEYDGGPSGQPHQKGELTKMTDESGQTVYSHDSMGRLIQKSVTIGSSTFTVGYSWGDAGSALDKLTAITYPSGTRVNYSYDQYGSVSGISVNPVNANGSGVSSSSVSLLSSITYNVDHSPTGWLWSDGKQRSIGYDANGFVGSYTLGDPTGTGNAAGVTRTVVRDAAGRITGYTHAGAGASGLDQTFAYDNLNRLTATTQGASSTSYSYDATGNRTLKTVAGTGYTNTVSPSSNRLTQVSSPAGTVSIGYDAMGNVTADGSATFTYSDRGRIYYATTSAGPVSYQYDGRNQRVRKIGPPSLVSTGEALFVYDESGQLLGEYDASGKPVYETIYLGSTPVGAMKQTGSAAGNDLTTNLHNVYADHIDTPRVITRQDHAIVWRWDTAEAFGSTAPNQNPSGLGAFVFNQRFPGQVFDQETGLFQNWNREYDSWIGRYRQSDPIGLKGGINTYLYVGGKPLTLTDIYGLLTGSMSCSEFVSGSVKKRTKDRTDEELLYTLYEPRPMVNGLGFGPGLDPRKPRGGHSPMQPEIDMTITMIEHQRWRYRTYRLTELLEAVLTICKWREKDNCGLEQEYSDSRSWERIVGSREDLISEELKWKHVEYVRFRFGVPVPMP